MSERARRVGISRNGLQAALSGDGRSLAECWLAELRSRCEEILAVARARGATRVRAFGSVARGECPATSDQDFLVDLEPTRMLLELGGLVMDLRDLLQRAVDFVAEQGLRPRVAARLLGVPPSS